MRFVQSCLSGRGCVHGGLLLPQTPHQSLILLTCCQWLVRGVSSLGGNSVCLCWMETDAYASQVERLMNSPVSRHQTMKRGQRFLKTVPTCSAAHRSSPPWLNLAIARPKNKKSLRVFQMHFPASSEKKPFLMRRSPGKRWLQSQSLILPPNGFSEAVCRCRCSSMRARRPSPIPGFAEDITHCMEEYSFLWADDTGSAQMACAASCELHPCTRNVKQVLDPKVSVL